MTVLIKGMEMPKNCSECQFCHTENFETWCCPTEREDIFYDAIPEWCPLTEPKTGEWILDPNGMDWNIPAWRCSECGFVANYIGVEANGMGKNPMNWAGSKFCPNCGAKMGGDSDG